MLKLFFRIFLPAMAAIALFETSAHAQEAMRGKSVPSNFEWDAQKESKFSYRLLSMDGKKRDYHVRVGDSFAQVEANTARSFDAIFFSNSPLITFYKKSMDGKDSLYTPVMTVNIGADKEDVVICLTERDGSTLHRVIDISQKNLGAGVFAVVNLSKKPFGVAIGNKLLRVEPFETAKQSFPQSDDIEEVPLKFYTLGNRPKLSYERYISFIKSQNLTFYVFDVPSDKEDGNDVPFLMRYGKPPRRK